MIKKIAILGCGHMGELVLQKLKEDFSKSKIVVTRKDPKKLSALAKKYGVDYVSDNWTAVLEADVIWLCMLPGQIVQVIKEIKPKVKKTATIISIAAAIDPSFIGKYFPGQTIIWYMPSPLLAEKKSVAVMTSIKKNKTTDFWRNIFKNWSTLLTEIPESERHLFTTIASCGSAFFAGILDKLVQSATSFSPKQKTQIEKVLVTVAADTFSSLQKKPYEAVREIISHTQTKGGLTQAGFAALQTKQAKKVFDEIVRRAVKRSEERQKKLQKRF